MSLCSGNISNYKLANIRFSDISGGSKLLTVAKAPFAKFPFPERRLFLRFQLIVNLLKNLVY